MFRWNGLFRQGCDGVTASPLLKHLGAVYFFHSVLINTESAVSFLILAPYFTFPVRGSRRIVTVVSYPKSLGCWS
jgi:hypothetical protein